MVVLAVTVAFGALSLAAPAVAGAVTGTQGPSFAGANASVPPSGPKPESKLWFNAGSWWGYLFDGASGDFHIFRFDTGTQGWTDTGVLGDTRNNTTADVLWDGAAQKLYVASHVQTDGDTGTGNNPAFVYRYSYGAGTYALDAGFPVQIHNRRMETLVIAKDSTGQLWATWTQRSPNKVWINSTVCSPACNDAAWGTPFSLNDAPLNAPAISNDDISSIIAFGGNKVGLFWSNQSTNADYFAVHNDSDASDTNWVVETATSGSGLADDHINLKTDANGRIFAATKTSLGGTGPLARLLVRTPAGNWVVHVFGLSNENHTRPIVLLDQAAGLIHMYASPETGGKIYEKTLPLADADSPVDFAPGLGTVFIDDGSTKLNNSTSTKQNLDASTGLLVLASNKSTDLYWQRYIPLVPDTTAPVLQTAAANGATLTLAYNEALNPASVPAAGAFSVNGGHSVTGANVTGSTVALTLSPAVIAGEAGLTLSYTPGASPIEDVAGNDAAALVNQAVTNSTPGGGSLTLLPNGDVSQTNVAKTGTTTFFDAIDDTIAGADDTTTLIRNSGTTGSSYLGRLSDTPAGFTSMSALTIDVRVRTTNRIDDNVTLFAQVFRSDGVTPLTNEVTVATNLGPPRTGRRSPGISFTGVVPADKATWDGAQLKLRWTYTPVGTSDGAQLKVTAAQLNATSGGGGGDVTAPVFQSASVNGAALTMTYNEALNTGSVPANGDFAISGGHSVTGRNVTGSTVVLTLSPAVINGETITLSYTTGTNPIEDVAGNDAANLVNSAVTNNTPGGGDVTAPVFQSASVNGAALTMTYNEALNTGSVPANGDFVISGGHSVTGRNVTGSTVVLTLSPAVINGETITLSYTTGTNPIEDVAGNDAANLVNSAVTNNTPGGGGGSLTLLPNGDGTVSPVGTIAASGTATLFDAIDDTIAAADDGTTLRQEQQQDERQLLRSAHEHTRELRADAHAHDRRSRADHGARRRQHGAAGPGLPGGWCHAAHERDRRRDQPRPDRRSRRSRAFRSPASSEERRRSGTALRYAFAGPTRRSARRTRHRSV